MGLAEGSHSRAKAEAEGYALLTRHGVCRNRPDHGPRPRPRATRFVHRAIGRTNDGDALFFAHGFNIRYDYIKPPATVGSAPWLRQNPGFTWCDASTSLQPRCPGDRGS